METDRIERQVMIALDKVKAAMERAGSPMERMVKTFMLLKHLEDYPKMRKAEVEYYQQHAPYLVDHPPVSTFMQLSNFANPEALLRLTSPHFFRAGSKRRKQWTCSWQKR